MDDASIAPSPARVAAARRAGLRPRSPWLVPAALCLALVAALPASPGEAPALREAFARGDLAGLRDMAFWTWLKVLAAAGLVAVAALVPSLGWVGRAPESERLPAVRRRSGALGGAVGLVAALLLVSGALAGAARAVDAEPSGLAALWLGWLRRGLLLGGCASLAVALVDLARARGQIWQALHETPAQARERGRG